MNKHIVVIGGGPAGIEAARAVTDAGGSATLVSEGPVGGRSGWHSLLPSKVWLSVADHAGNQDMPAPDAILTHLHRVKKEWNSQQVDGMKTLGVNIRMGIATFEAADRMVVKDPEGHATSLSADAIILATGSVPFLPPNLKPDGNRIIAPRFMSTLKTLPSSMAVIGGGATGTEVAYLFNRLGVEVTWVVDQYGVLPSFLPAAGEMIGDVLVRRGVKLIRGEKAENVEYEGNEVIVALSDGSHVHAEMAFVAIGRVPDLNRLNLEAAGLVLGKRKFPETDPYCQTGVSGIYAVGDAAGPPMVANRAMAMAHVAGRHATGASVAPFNPDTVVCAIYSEPQVAQVGKVTGSNGSILTTRVDYSSVMKSHLLSESEGFLELAYSKDGKVTGGVAAGPHAGDVLAPVALAIQVGATLKDMATIFTAHPTFSELAFAATRLAEIIM